MPISWFPGHMHKARKALAKVMQGTDLVIEILDARTPAASSNPLLATLRGDLPCLRILNKSDLADPLITAQWLSYFRALKDSGCLVNGLDQVLEKSAVVQAAKKLLADKPRGKTKKLQFLIVGIPNVGKSTLMNQVMGRKLAKTGNEPAITKDQQRVKLDDDCYLVDTPGLLWPRLEDQTAAYRLASTGTIRNTAVDAHDIAFFAAEVLLRDFYPLLQRRYNIAERPTSPELLLELIARSRGALGRQATVDWNKVSELFLNDFRSGKIGRLSLETPPV